MGAEPVAYGECLLERVRALAPDGVDLALDVAGNGILADLIELTGGPGHAVTIADFKGAREHGVRFSGGQDGRAFHAIEGIGELIESGRFWLPVAQAFRLAGIAEAHRVGEGGLVRGKLVLLLERRRSTSPGQAKFGSVRIGRPLHQRPRIPHARAVRWQHAKA